jgi:hypothetical protein
MHGYDTYDIEWRQYYPAIMRFQTPDSAGMRWRAFIPCGHDF